MDSKFENILSNMNLLFKENDYVVAGISGGPDSMALLDLLIKLRDKKKINIVCAHIHHNVRRESDDELIFVRNYCIKNNVEFESMKIEQEIKSNFENEARKIRYDHFNKLVKKYKAKYLLTAHHGDDLIETILMRIVRGSNIKGYSGFSEIIDNKSYKIFKPLIYVTKDQILEYNKNNNIPWVEDYTNKEDEHTRNRYRKYILPKLKEEDINVNDKFLKFSKDMIECTKYIEEIIQVFLQNNYKNNILDIIEYKKENEFIRKNIIYAILEKNYKDNIYLINNKHVLAIDEIIMSNKSNMFLSLPNNIIAVKSYNKFYTELKTQIDSYCITLEEENNLPNGKKIIKEETSDMTNNYICRLNSEELKLPLKIRNRQDGDYIYIKNLNGKKKVKDIYIDEKLELRDRKLWPIVTDSENNIVWLPGLKKSKYDKQKTEKYDIILRYL